MVAKQFDALRLIRSMGESECDSVTMAAILELIEAHVVLQRRFDAHVQDCQLPEPPIPLSSAGGYSSWPR